MKKIMTALTLGALIGTVAFADVDINLGFRQRANMYYNHEGTGKLFNTDIYADNGTDNFTFGLSGDIASFDLVLVSDEKKTDQIRAKKAVGSLYLGNLTLQAGVADDGLATGAYRVTSDNGNLEGVDWEWKKMGSGFKKSPSKFVDNPVMPVNAADKSYFAGGSWKQKFSNGALDFKAFYITNEWANKTNAASDKADGSGSWQGHTVSFLANYLNDDLGQGEVVFKVGQTSNKSLKTEEDLTAMAFGLYLQPKIVNPLILTVGGAGSVVDSKFTDWSVDLRARVQVIPSKLGVTLYTSFSALTSDGEGLVQNEAERGIANCSGANMKGSAIKRDKLWVNNLMIRYKMNSTLNLIAVASNMNGFGKVDGVDKDYDAHVQLRFSGWTQFFASGSASVMVGVVAAIDDVANYAKADNHKSTWDWGVPVIFRVTF